MCCTGFFSLVSSNLTIFPYDQHVAGFQYLDEENNGAVKSNHYHHHQQEDTFIGFNNIPFPAPPSFPEFVPAVKSLSNELPPLTRPSWELLKSHGTGFKRMRTSSAATSLSYESQSEVANFKENISVEQIIRMAGARYLHFCDLKYDDFSMVMHPFGFALSSLSDDETKDVELVHLLLAAADKVGNQQLDRTCMLLARCEWIYSERSTPVQRIVYSFADALRERNDKVSTRHVLSKEVNDVTDHGLVTDSTSVTPHQKLPFFQVMHFAGIQVIVEHVASAHKIHAVDLDIRSGVQSTIFMQAIADRRECPVESLTITAVEFSGERDMGRISHRLVAVAKSLNLPFSFQTVRFAELKGPREVLLMDIKPDETVVVFAPLILRTMLARPSSLEMLMRVIESWNPSLMVLIEVEANHNASSFNSRFIESLFFYIAMFDCIEACTGQDAELRACAEEIFYGGIRSMVVKEEEERVARSVKMEVWRAFFAKFRMVEQEMSESSFYQASLVIKEFACSESCTLQRDERSVVVGWKGAPIFSVSAWKFSRERGRFLGNYRF